jgi:hypothetical protein
LVGRRSRKKVLGILDHPVRPGDAGSAGAVPTRAPWDAYADAAADLEPDTEPISHADGDCDSNGYTIADSFADAARRRAHAATLRRKRRVHGRRNRKT